MFNNVLRVDFFSWRAAERIRQQRSERLRCYTPPPPSHQRWCSCQEKLICMSFSCRFVRFFFLKLWPSVTNAKVGWWCKKVKLCVPTSVNVHKRLFPREICKLNVFIEISSALWHLALTIILLRTRFCRKQKPGTAISGESVAEF